MQRVLSSAALIGLLIATAAAFAITERLKLVRSPVYFTIVSKRLSPSCGCSRGKAVISFRLRHRDDVTLTIVDGNRTVVKTLASGEPTAKGRVTYSWSGTTDGGGIAPDGTYLPELHLSLQRRTILLPNPIVLDTHPAQVVGVRVGRGIVSPDGDGVGDSIKIHYRLDSQAHLLIYLGSDLVIRSRSYLASGTVNWLGRDANGEALPAGNYVLWLGAVDRAGNVTQSYDRQPIVVTVRYIQLLQQHVAAAPGKRFSIGVSTDAKHYWWKLGTRHGVASGSVLSLRAPTKPGSYRLAVGERVYGARGTVLVTTAK